MRPWQAAAAAFATWVEDPRERQARRQDDVTLLTVRARQAAGAAPPHRRDLDDVAAVPGL